MNRRRSEEPEEVVDKSEVVEIEPQGPTMYQVTYLGPGAIYVNPTAEMRLTAGEPVTVDEETMIVLTDTRAEFDVTRLDTPVEPQVTTEEKLIDG